MHDFNKDKLILFLLGVLIAFVVMLAGGFVLYKVIKVVKQPARYQEQGISEKISRVMKRFSSKDFYLSFEDRNDINTLIPQDGAASEISTAHATHGNHSLLLKIRGGKSFPGLLWEVYGSGALNLSQAKDFHMDIFNNTEESVRLEAKFKSGKEEPKKTYSFPIQLEPLANNHISIPIDSIKGSCDITQISYIKIFAQAPAKDIILYFDNIGIRDPNEKDKVSPKGEAAAITGGKAKKVLKEGFEILVASSLDRVFQDGRTLVKPMFSATAAISAAGNEYESFQIVINNGKRDIKSVGLEISDLVDGKTGAKISKDNISWRIVGYIPTKKPYYPVKFVGLWPDPLMPAETKDIGAGETQPLWVTVYVPPGAVVGNYSGTVTVNSYGNQPQKVFIALEVYDFTLPRESHLKTAFDFYEHLTRLRYLKTEKEDDAQYQARLAEINDAFHIEMLKHRMDPVLNVDPTSQTDLGRVDRYRVFGLTNFSIGRKGGTFNNNWPKGDQAIEELLGLYRTYGEILSLNKMLPMNYVYTWDEGEFGNPMVPKICSMIHRAYKGLKNMVCYHGFWDPEKDPEWGKDIDIWCFQIDNFNQKMFDRLKSIGKEMWMYISGPSGYGSPNLAMDFDSIDYRMAPWLCWKYDITGFLYWSVNYWELANPFETAVSTKWEQNGNGVLFYPGKDGPIASLRAEIWRDGMEDYEYIQILVEKIKELKRRGLDGQNEGIIKESINLLTVDKTIASSMFSFTKDSSVLLERRNKIAGMIEKVGELLK